jgi:FkbM family methyltransferase
MTDNILDRLNPYAVEVNRLKSDDIIKTADFNPLSIVNSNRIDIIAKYIFAKSIVENKNVDWAKEVYSEHLRAFNGFREGDYSNKNSLEVYISEFNSLINSIKSKGFDPKISIVPLSENGVAIDGGHRVAASLVFNAPIRVVFLKRNDPIYDWKFFSKNGLDRKYLDYLTLEYIKLKKNIYVFCIWPAAKGRKGDLLNVLNNCGKIIYEKKIKLSKKGAHNFILHTYIQHPWVGKWQDGFSGVYNKMKACFPGYDKNVSCYFIESDDYTNIYNAKQTMRDLFGLANDTVHSTDNYEETLLLSKIILNANSIHFINNSTPWKFENFNSLFEKYRDAFKNSGEGEIYCVDSSSVLSAFGIREARDFDFITDTKEPLIFSQAIDNHEDNLTYYEISKDEIIYNPSNHFYLLGLKFVSLKQMLSMKKNRGEFKDYCDILLAKTFLIGCNLLIIAKLIVKVITYIFKTKALIYAMYKRILHFIIEHFTPFIRTKKYLGFELYYSRGTSLVNRIKQKNTIYEQSTCELIKSQLEQKPNPVIIDIGANIGLISLYIANRIKNAKIYAFEPGPHQFNLFQKTISKNNLGAIIDLSNIALSNSEGFAVFHVHNTRDVSGDGFIDTERAGQTKKINVKVCRLDKWWYERNKLFVDLIKIDTEGAELWVLQGAIELIKTCRPVIITEINHINYKNYPYNEYDVLNFIFELGYDIYEEGGVLVTSANLSGFQKRNIDTYLCIPK